MDIADREFEEAVPKALRLAVQKVDEEGTANRLEWLRQRYANFIHGPFSIDVGEGANRRRIYGVVVVSFSDLASIETLVHEMRNMTQTDL